MPVAHISDFKCKTSYYLKGQRGAYFSLGLKMSKNIDIWFFLVKVTNRTSIYLKPAIYYVFDCCKHP